VSLFTPPGGTLIEFVGGPIDGERRAVPQLLGRLEYLEPLQIPRRPIGERLEAGEQVPAKEILEPQFVVHLYSRSEPARVINLARVYTYVAPSRG
jgi:hypothetical protein